MENQIHEFFGIDFDINQNSIKKEFNFRKRNDSLIFHCIKYEKIDMISFILELGISLNSIKSHKRYTPLTYACSKDNLEIVELLLNKKVNPNLYDGNRLLPLYICIRNYNYDIVQLLVSHGANINYDVYRDYGGILPPFAGIMENIFHNLEDITFAFIDGLFALGLDISNSLYPYIWHSVSEYYSNSAGNYSAQDTFIQVLLNYGANPYIEVMDDFYDYENSLELAYDLNIDSIYRLLLQNGMYIHLKQTFPDKVLGFVSHNFYSTMRYLLDNNFIDVNMMINTLSGNVSLISVACEYAHRSLNMIHTLVKAGADINTPIKYMKDNNLQMVPPFEIVCEHLKKDNPKIIQYFLNYNAIVTKTILEMWFDNAYLKCIKLVLSKNNGNNLLSKDEYIQKLDHLMISHPDKYTDIVEIRNLISQ